MAISTCRSQFTANDLNFITERLASSPANAKALTALFQDPGCLNEILDTESLHGALIDETSCVRVSPAFYFYVLVRRTLLRHGLDDRNLCDYISTVLTSFMRREQLDRAHAPKGARAYAYLSDLLMTIDSAPPAQVFELRRFVGDYALFFSGLFRDFIDAKRHGAPGVSFYESVGRQSYRSAAAHPQALREDLRDILQQAGEAFHEVRLSLNEIAERFLHFEKPPVIVTPN